MASRFILDMCLQCTSSICDNLTVVRQALLQGATYTAGLLPPCIDSAVCAVTSAAVGLETLVAATAQKVK